MLMYIFMTWYSCNTCLNALLFILSMGKLDILCIFFLSKKVILSSSTLIIFCILFFKDWVSILWSTNAPVCKLFFSSRTCRDAAQVTQYFRGRSRMWQREKTAFQKEAVVKLRCTKSNCEFVFRDLEFSPLPWRNIKVRGILLMCFSFKINCSV